MDFCKNESQIGLELLALLRDVSPVTYDPSATRQEMASIAGLEVLADADQPSEAVAHAESDLQLIDF